MSGVESFLACDGCGAWLPVEERHPFRCPGAVAADDTDHALRRRLQVAPEARSRLAEAFDSLEPNPLVRFRELFHVYWMARAHGIEDQRFVDAARELDRRVRLVSGSGLEETSYLRSEAISQAVGCEGLWIKDETGNIGGTHKGRHLASVLLWLLLERELESEGVDSPSPLAISSCGNAAWAAAILAKSVDWPLDVFVPSDAPRAAYERLSRLGARWTPCERRPGERGDPCYRSFSEAVDRGALPFTCQGPSNGLVIEGGQTLIWEIVGSLIRNGGRLDRMVVQTGGGALASACVLGWREARQIVPLDKLPRLHAVQTTGAWPLVRAYDALAERLADRHLGLPGRRPRRLEERAELAALLRERMRAAEIQEELRYAVSHRSQFMWPWEEQPHSMADAILDDETYDWLPLLSGMFESGGYPVVVPEERFAEANRLAHASVDIDVGDTGSAGLAGALELADAGEIGAGEHVAVLFTGVRWGSPARRSAG